MKYLVVDAGPIIKGARLDVAQADRYITVPEVLLEVRDRQSRSGLRLLPFDISTKEPSAEAVAKVSAFARKTGDYAALSVPDIKVLALVWMLEKETNGARHLRDTPQPLASVPAKAGAPSRPEPSSRKAAGPESRRQAGVSAGPAADGDGGGATGRGEEDSCAPARQPATCAAPAVADAQVEADAEAADMAEVAAQIVRAALEEMGEGGDDDDDVQEDLGDGEDPVVVRSQRKAPHAGHHATSGNARDIAPGASPTLGAAPPLELRAIPAARVSLRLTAVAGSRVRLSLDLRLPKARMAPAPSGWEVLPGWAQASVALGEDAVWRREASDSRSAGVPLDSLPQGGKALRDAGAAASPHAGEAVGPDPEDEGLPWITPDSLKSHQRQHSRFGYVPDASTDVCCMTTDFAMQNVIMRMGMKLLSTDGLVMRSVKQWGMRCSGCMRTTHDTGRQFCAHCGNATLVRVAIVVDREGRERVLPMPAHVQTKALSTRGTVYSMPAPKQGRNAGNVITAEDELAEARWKHVRNGGARKVAGDVFDENYDFDAHFARAGKQPKGRMRREPTVGMGKKNPNDVRSCPKKR